VQFVIRRLMMAINKITMVPYSYNLLGHSFIRLRVHELDSKFL